jgi:hypothetical protein
MQENMSDGSLGNAYLRVRSQKSRFELLHAQAPSRVGKGLRSLSSKWVNGLKCKINMIIACYRSKPAIHILSPKTLFLPPTACGRRTPPQPTCPNAMPYAGTHYLALSAQLECRHPPTPVRMHSSNLNTASASRCSTCVSQAKVSSKAPPNAFISSCSHNRDHMSSSMPWLKSLSAFVGSTPVMRSPPLELLCVSGSFSS